MKYFNCVLEMYTTQLVPLYCVLEMYTTQLVPLYCVLEMYTTQLVPLYCVLEMDTTQLVPLYCDKHYSQLAGGYKNNNRGEFIMLLCLLLIFPNVSFMMSLLLVFI